MRARVRIADVADRLCAEALLRADGVQVADGGHADLLVVDEWTPEQHPEVVAARRQGTPVTVLAELVLRRARGPVVGVTGTAGKTSTCRALEQLLRSAGREVAVSSTARSSNAWPDHSLADGCGPEVVTIAELTSTHLCHMREVHPDVAVVTLIRPDHVELHGSLAAYVAAKRRLVEDLDAGDWIVLPADDPATCAALGDVPARALWFGDAAPDAREGVFARGEEMVIRWSGAETAFAAPVRGTALRAAMAAAAAALALGVPPATIRRATAVPAAVPHRLRPVPGPRGITVYDDTMAATPLKAHAAMREMPPGPVVAVIGGDDALSGPPVHASPEEDDALAAALADMRQRADVVVAFGPAHRRITAVIPVDVVAGAIEDALDAAMAACPDGGAVLVSPMFPMRPAEREHVATLG